MNSHHFGDASSETTIHTTPAASTPAAPALPRTRAASAEARHDSGPSDAGGDTRLPFIGSAAKIDLSTAPPEPVFKQPPRKRIHLPRAEELSLVPGALKNIAELSDYESMLGQTVPARAATTQALEAAYELTILRQALVAWAEYIAMQEADAWGIARSYMRRLQTPIECALEMVPEIATQNEDLLKLLGVRRAIARRGVSTRKTNQAAREAGGAAYSGKRRKRRDLKAELAAELAREKAAGDGTHE